MLFTPIIATGPGGEDEDEEEIIDDGGKCGNALVLNDGGDMAEDGMAE